MSFLKKKIYHIGFNTILFLIVSMGMWSIQNASAATDAVSCAAAGGDCKLKYNAAGITYGMSCSAQTSGSKPTESGTCYSDAQVLPSEVPKDVVKICCTPVAPPPPGETCTGICRSDCNAGETSSGICSVTAGKCCKPATTSTSTSINFINPLAFDTVEGVLGSILSTLRGIIVVLSLVFIVIGAVLYILSAGDDTRMKTAKGAITASMIGLAIGIAAPSFLRQISDILGWGNPSLSTVKTLTEIALSTLQFLLSIVGILGLIMLVIGGMTYITSAGDQNRSETGKKIVTYAIIGISVALASLIIVTQIAKLFV